MCGTLVISVITRQHGKEFLKDIWILFIEVCGTLVICVNTRQNGKELLKHIYNLFMERIKLWVIEKLFFVTSVKSHFHKIAILKFIEKPTLVRNIFHVINVQSHFHKIVI